MNWIVLSYTLTAAGGTSGPRVALWRRLKRLGAVSPAGGIQVLPARESCVEAFGWLAQEIRQEGGEALVFHVEAFDGLSTEQVIALFCEARKKDYTELMKEMRGLEQLISETSMPEQDASLQNSFQKLSRQYRECLSIDYFNCPEGVAAGKMLDQIERLLRHSASRADDISPAALEAYRGRRWVTRPRPHVDRLASIWFIRHFIDPDAVVRFAPTPEPDEVAFDMPDGQFTHQGNRCTLETMMRAFRLEDNPGLRWIAEVVHAIDLQDGLYQRPEIAGIEAVLQGWLLADFSDAELSDHGTALFAGLYAAFFYRGSSGDAAS